MIGTPKHFNLILLVGNQISAYSSWKYIWSKITWLSSIMLFANDLYQGIVDKDYYASLGSSCDYITPMVSIKKIWYNHLFA